MRTRIVISACGLWCLIGTTSNAMGQTPAAEPVPIKAGVELTAVSAYVWRGFVPSDMPSMQSNVWVARGSFMFAAWVNVEQPSSRISERDLALDYTRAVGAVSLSTGWMDYAFPSAAIPRSSEWYAGAAIASRLNPSVRLAIDPRAGNGWYANGAIAPEFQLGTHAAITPSIGVGYNGHQWIDRSTWSDAVFAVKARVPLPGTRAAISPYLAYSRSLCGELFPSRFTGGVTLSVR